MGRGVTLSKRGRHVVYYTEGLELFRRGLWEKAIVSLTAALSFRDSDSDALLARSRCYVHLGLFDEAIRDADKVIAIDEETTGKLSWKAYKGVLQKAETYYARGDYETALLYYHRGRAKRPDVHAFDDGIRKCETAIERILSSTGPEARPPISPLGPCPRTTLDSKGESNEVLPKEVVKAEMVLRDDAALAAGIPEFISDVHLLLKLLRDPISQRDTPMMSITNNNSHPANMYIYTAVRRGERRKVRSKPKLQQRPMPIFFTRALPAMSHEQKLWRKRENPNKTKHQQTPRRSQYLKQLINTTLAYLNVRRKMWARRGSLEWTTLKVAPSGEKPGQRPLPTPPPNFTRPTKSWASAARLTADYLAQVYGLDDGQVREGGGAQRQYPVARKQGPGVTVINVTRDNLGNSGPGDTHTAVTSVAESQRPVKTPLAATPPAIFRVHKKGELPRIVPYHFCEPPAQTPLTGVSERNAEPTGEFYARSTPTPVDAEVESICRRGVSSTPGLTPSRPTTAAMSDAATPLRYTRSIHSERPLSATLTSKRELLGPRQHSHQRPATSAGHRPCPDWEDDIRASDIQILRQHLQQQRASSGTPGGSVPRPPTSTSHARWKLNEKRPHSAMARRDTSTPSLDARCRPSTATGVRPTEKHQRRGSMTPVAVPLDRPRGEPSRRASGSAPDETIDLRGVFPDFFKRSPPSLVHSLEGHENDDSSSDDEDDEETEAGNQRSAASLTKRVDEIKRYLLDSDVHSAVQLAQEVIDEISDFTHKGSEKELIELCEMVGTCYALTKDFSEASKYFTKQVVFSSKHRDTTGYFRGVSRLVDLYKSCGDSLLLADAPFTSNPTAGARP